MVGNSHAISIPKEIVEFINDQHKFMKRKMDDMVRLCFEDFDTLKLMFGDDDYEKGLNNHEPSERMKMRRMRRFEN